MFIYIFIVWVLIDIPELVYMITKDDTEGSDQNIEDNNNLRCNSSNFDRTSRRIDFGNNIYVRILKLIEYLLGQSKIA